MIGEQLRGTTTHYRRWTMADGTQAWVEIADAVYWAMVDHDRRAGERERKRKRREKTFSELGIDAATRFSYAWEGERYHFRWLVGEGRVWDGDPRFLLERQWYCSVCWERTLPGHAYCLGCDRSGRDEDVGTPTPEDLARRLASVPRRDGMRGGIGD